jgi:hypothetical protein
MVKGAPLGAGFRGEDFSGQIGLGKVNDCSDGAGKQNAGSALVDIEDSCQVWSVGFLP